MKKISVIILFILPILVFTIITVSGSVVNDLKYVEATSVEIVGENIQTIEQTGDKYIVVNETGYLQLSYNVYPENATEQSVTWEVVEGSEFVTINEYGIVNITKLGGDVIIKLWDSNHLKSDTLIILTR